MVAVEADKFLNELGRLFERTKAKGSVSITMKRSALPFILCAGLLILGYNLNAAVFLDRQFKAQEEQVSARGKATLPLS